jgi:hypothetical protein
MRRGFKGAGKKLSLKTAGKQSSLCKWDEETSPAVEFVIGCRAKRVEKRSREAG